MRDGPPGPGVGGGGGGGAAAGGADPPGLGRGALPQDRTAALACTPTPARMTATLVHWE